jgi:hypothetical protein
MAKLALMVYRQHIENGAGRWAKLVNHSLANPADGLLALPLCVDGCHAQATVR